MINIAQKDDAMHIAFWVDRHVSPKVTVFMGIWWQIIF